MSTEQRYRALVDAGIVGVTVTDEERVLEANDAFLAMVGRSRAELDAGAVSWRALTPREWLAADDRVLERLAREGRVEPYEKEYARADGSRIPVLVSGVQLAQDPLRVIAIVIDLSERRAAEREREQLLAREREARREAELAADRTARLQRVSAALSAAFSGDEVGVAVVEQAREALGCSAAALAFVDGDEVVMRHERGFEAERMAPWRRFPLRSTRRSATPCAAASPCCWSGSTTGSATRRCGAGSTVSSSRWPPIPLQFGGTKIGRSCCATSKPRTFVAGDRAFLSALAVQAAQALEHARLFEQRGYVARTLQEGLLPERIASVPGLEVAVRYHSIADGGEVGGDFYDCFDIPGDRWLVAVGDVAGKGTAAAVLTGLARHTLRAIALRDEQPDDMLRFLNEALRRQSAEAAFCTVGCATLARAGDGFSAVLASGGHPYPLLVRAGGEVEEVVVRGTLLGVEAEPALERIDLELRPGDTLVLFTDGMTDACARSGERFGEQRLHAAVGAAAGGSADAVAAAIDAAVAGFEGDRRRDDRALVVLRVSP